MIAGARSSRSGGWPIGIGCIGARCARRWPARHRRRGRPRRAGAAAGPGQGVDRCDAARGPRRAPQAAPHRPAGASPGWSRSTAQTEITYSTVRDYVRVRRPEIWAAAGRSLEEVFVPQTHEPGAHAEVDFADLWIILGGVKTKVFLFTFRLSFSGKAVHRAFATQSQEAFLEGHVAAFAVLGGLPVVHVRYDNLKAAVGAGAVRAQPGRVRALGDVPLALRVRVVLLHPGRRGRSREGRRRGRGRPVPAQPSGPGAGGRLAGRAQHPPRGVRRRDDARRITGRPQTSVTTSPSRPGSFSRCRKRGSRPG